MSDDATASQQVDSLDEAISCIISIGNELSDSSPDPDQDVDELVRYIDGTRRFLVDAMDAATSEDTEDRLKAAYEAISAASEKAHALDRDTVYSQLQHGVASYLEDRLDIPSNPSKGDAE